MREPGRFLLRLTRALGLTRLRETVVLPAVADMQYECGEAGSGVSRARALARGYWSIVAASVLYAAFLPARHVRENWAGMHAPGPRLLGKAWRPAAVVTVVGLGIAVASWPGEGQLGAGVVALLLPSMLVSGMPLALAIGVGWALARDPAGSRAALAVGIVGAGLSFAFFDMAVTRANQEYRVASYRVLTGRTEKLRKGSREMTFRELGSAASLDDDRACTGRAGMSTCTGGATPAAFRSEWHNRLSIAALALSFVVLAAGLARSGRRLVVVLGLWLTYAVASLILSFGQKHGAAGDIPLVLAAWGVHLVPLSLAVVVHHLWPMTSSPERSLHR